MSEPTRKSDIIESGIFDEFISDVRKLKEGIKEQDEALRKLSQTMKGELDSANKKTIQGMEKISRLQKTAEKQVKAKRANQKTLTTLEREEAKLLKQKERLIAQESKSYKKLEKDVNNLKEAKKRKAKSDRDEAKQMQRNTNAYTKLSDASRRYKNESKTLGAELLALEQAGKKNSRVWNETQKRYSQVTAKAQTTDKQLKKLDKTVGDGSRTVGLYATGLRKATNILATLGVAAGVGQIFRNVGGIIADFDQAVTDLGAISGKTAEELAPLTAQAKQLGETTQFSASEVTGLQIELAKLGFTTQEIMDSTGGIANFAAATGVEIPRAAALAGSALRAFGLDATEIDRVVSTLGVATTKTALDFSKLENGLSTVAPVAKAFGFSIEDTTALLGQLANSGFDASSAATATRNILLNLADANGDLAKQLGRPIKSADDLAAGLAELQEKGVDLGEALELTDKRSVAAFQTFLDGSGSLVELRDSITDVNGELTDMANKRLDSVGGAMKLLNSAWEGFILNLNESIGASDAFQSVIKFVAANLGTIIGTIGKLVAGFLAYKTALIAINIQQKIAGKGVGQLAKQFFTLGKNAKGAAGQSSKMGSALKGIGWAALIGVAIELAVSFYDIASGAAEARRKAKELDDYRADADKKSTESVNKYNKEYEKRLFNLNEEERILKSKAKTQQEVDEIALEFLEKRQKEAAKQTKLFDTLNQQAQEKIDKDLKSIEVLEKLNVSNGQILDGNEELAKQLREAGFENAKYNSTWASINVTVDEAIRRKSELTAKVEAARVRQENYTAALEQADKILTTVTNDIAVDSNERENNRDKINAQVKDLKDQNDELEKQSHWLDENVDYWQQYFDQIQKMRDEDDILTIDESEFGDMIGEAPIIPEDEMNEFEDQQKQIVSILNQTQKAITEALTANIDTRIDLFDREAQAAKEQQDYLQGLAEQGNIEAGQSITEEREREIAALREKERLEKQKATLELISSALEVFSTSLEEGASPQEALAQTVLTTGALTEFLSGLNFFAEGTDNAPAGLAVVGEEGPEAQFSKSGKFQGILGQKGAEFRNMKGGEQILTAPETMDWMKQSAMMSQLTPMKQDVAGNSYDLLSKDIKEMTKAVKNMPTNDWSVEEAAKNVMNLIKTTKQGGDKRVSKYRVKY